MSQVTSVLQTRLVIGLRVCCPIRSALVNAVKIPRTCLAKSRDDLPTDHFKHAVKRGIKYDIMVVLKSPIFPECL